MFLIQLNFILQHCETTAKGQAACSISYQGLLNSLFTKRIWTMATVRHT